MLNVLKDALLAAREDFWNPDVLMNIEDSTKNKTILETLALKGKASNEPLPPHLLAIAKSDVLIENYRRLEGIQAEVEAIAQLKVSVPDWESQIAERLADKKVVVADHKDYILLADKEWLAEQSDTAAA